MRKFFGLTLVAVLTTLLVIGAASAATGHPAAKATAKVGDVAILDSTGIGWTTILQNTIKTPNQKDLFIDVSLECGLYTKTKVKSKAGEEVTSMAEAGVKVKVLVDGAEAFPGEVVFCRRTQTLTAVFAGYFKDLVLTEEELELILDTMNANAFNFILDDLGSGVHTIEVQAKIDTAKLGEAEAYGTIGNGSVTVEEVRMIKDEDIELP